MLCMSPERAGTIGYSKSRNVAEAWISDQGLWIIVRPYLSPSLDLKLSSCSLVV
jgi:hypothetical protein